MSNPGSSAVAALALAVVLVAGCGSSSTKAGSPPSTTTVAPAAPEGTTSTVAPSTSTSTATPKDPCTYVTNSEVAGATGKTVTASQKVNDFSCSYTTSDNGTVQVGVAGPTTRAIVEGQLRAETAAGTLPPTMSGLGDAAYRTLGGIAVVKGTQSIRITVFGSGSYAPDGNAGAVALARLVLGRLVH